MAKSLLMGFLDNAVLRRMAGSQSFARGEDYFADGRVKDISLDDRRLEALVVGTRKYRVKLWVEQEAVQHSCTCPMGEAGNLCKHCVAAAMAFLAESGRKPQARSKPAERNVTMQDVRTMLLKQDHESLVGMILGWAETEDRLRERLLLVAAKQTKRGVNLAKFRHAIEVALDPGGFLDYHDMPSYAHDASEVIDRIEDLRREGHSEAAIELSEYALKAAERAMNSMDDSDGYMHSTTACRGFTYWPVRRPNQARQRLPRSFSRGRCAASGRSFSVRRRLTPKCSVRLGWRPTESWLRRNGRRFQCDRRAVGNQESTDGTFGSLILWKRWHGCLAILRRWSP